MITTKFVVKPEVVSMHYDCGTARVLTTKSTVEIVLESCTDAELTALFEEFVQHDTEVETCTT